jgi:hypothetical protein
MYLPDTLLCCHYPQDGQVVGVFVARQDSPTCFLYHGTPFVGRRRSRPRRTRRSSRWIYLLIAWPILASGCGAKTPGSVWCGFRGLSIGAKLDARCCPSRPIRTRDAQNRLAARSRLRHVISQCLQIFIGRIAVGGETNGDGRRVRRRNWCCIQALQRTSVRQRVWLVYVSNRRNGAHPTWKGKFAKVFSPQTVVRRALWVVERGARRCEAVRGACLQHAYGAKCTTSPQSQ